MLKCDSERGSRHWYDDSAREYSFSTAEDVHEALRLAADRVAANERIDRFAAIRMVIEEALENDREDEFFRTLLRPSCPMRWKEEAAP